MSLRDALRLWAALAPLLACTGDIMSQGAATPPPGFGPADPTGAGDGRPSGGATASACRASTAGARPGAALRRLGKHELGATLKDLFHGRVDALVDEELDVVPDDHVVYNLGGFARFHAAEYPKALLALGEQIGETVASGQFARAGQPTELDCLGEATVRRECVTVFIDAFGLRSHRRPLSAAEKQAFLRAFDGQPTAKDGVVVLVAAMIGAPATVFQLEEGTVAVGSRVRLSDHEVASRISYMVTGTMPDAALLGAAGAGALDSLDAVGVHVDRLMKTARGRQRMLDFFRFWLGFEPKEINRYVAKDLGIATAGLIEEMITEARDFAAHVLWEKRGGYADLLTATEAFSRSARLARIMDTGPWQPGKPPQQVSPQRAGVLLRPILLASSGHTQIIHRASRYREDVLCSPLPPPPADADLVAAENRRTVSHKTMSNRQVIAAVTSPPLCMACHHSLNNIGYTLESFDQLGRLRAVERAFDDDGTFLAEHPIDTRVDHLGIGGPVNRADSARDLVNLTVGHPNAAACLARRIFQHARLRAETGADSCLVDELARSIARGAPLADVFRQNVVSDDIFWRQ
jgi:hypothetical protein